MLRFISNDFEEEAIGNYEIIENNKGEKQILINYLNGKKRLIMYATEEESRILKIQLVNLISAVYQYKEQGRIGDIVRSLVFSIAFIGLYIISIFCIENRNYQALMMALDIILAVVSFLILKESIKRLMQYGKYKLYLANCDLLSEKEELIKNEHGLEVAKINPNNIDDISTKKIRKKIKKIKKEKKKNKK